MAATLDDPLVRVQLFRFIDALPALKDAGSIRRHLAEYLAEAGDAVPWWLSLAMRLAPEGTTRAEWLAAAARRRGRRDGPEIHRRGHARRGHADRAGPPRGASWPSRPTCSARRSSARPRPTGTSRPAWP